MDRPVVAAGLLMAAVGLLIMAADRLMAAVGLLIMAAGLLMAVVGPLIMAADLIMADTTLMMHLRQSHLPSGNAVAPCVKTDRMNDRTGRIHPRRLGSSYIYGGSMDGTLHHKINWGDANLKEPIETLLKGLLLSRNAITNLSQANRANWTTKAYANTANRNQSHLGTCQPNKTPDLRSRVKSWKEVINVPNLANLSGQLDLHPHNLAPDLVSRSESWKLPVKVLSLANLSGQLDLHPHNLAPDLVSRSESWKLPVRVLSLVNLSGQLDLHPHNLASDLVSRSESWKLLARVLHLVKLRGQLVKLESFLWTTALSPTISHDRHALSETRGKT
jgi:hypothetical protein